MDPPDLEFQDDRDREESPSAADVLEPGAESSDDPGGTGWLEEIIARLEADPDECRPAVESLSAIDEEARIQVIAALAEHRERPAIRELFRLLGSAPDPAVRASALRALPQDHGSAAQTERDDVDAVGPERSLSVGPQVSLPVVLAGRAAGDRAGGLSHLASPIVRSLVTAIDGDGRGTIVLSASDGTHRRTAAFRTDVRRGIIEVAGEVEPEQPSAGRLVDEWIGRAEGGYAVDVPELALGLLGGCLGLSGPDLPDRVGAWLEATIGREALPVGLPPVLPGPEFEDIPDEEMPARADRILDACPAWLDRSALTFEMAEEITLREGDVSPDPVRDAGAYRYLFEHLLIHRLDLFSRMLLWMGWVWHASRCFELSHSAFVLAGQLSDEQYAVPSHPFTVALSTRSLQAAQETLLRGDRSRAGALRDPRARAPE